MKALASAALALLFAPSLLAADVPDVLSVLKKDALVKGATTIVVPPDELAKFVNKVEEAARSDPEWFREQTKKAPQGVPLPFDPKLGLTQQEYDEYLKLWDAREFKAVEAVVITLSEDSEGMWRITTANGAQAISTLKYDPKKDVFISPNGTMNRLEDVKADKRSILGEWTGHEWKFEEENEFEKTKENFAIGKTADGKFGLLVYRMQAVTSEGTRLQDDSLVVRFALGEAGVLKPEDLKR